MTRDVSPAGSSQQAGVCRAGLDGHFPEAGELGHAQADALGNELIVLIEAATREFADAAKRIGFGVRLYLREARDNPALARLLAHRGLSAASLVHQYLPAHVAWGNHTARFSDTTAESAIDVIAGATLAAVQRIADGQARAGHAEDVALSILKSLGVPTLQARRLVKIELPPLHPPAGSLLMRARSLQVQCVRPRPLPSTLLPPS